MLLSLVVIFTQSIQLSKIIESDTSIASALGRPELTLKVQAPQPDLKIHPALETQPRASALASSALFEKWWS